jgi:predicted MFS family arabinose efflux permease
MSLVTGIPTALLVKDRGAPPEYPVKWPVFRDACFSWHFAAGAVGIFPIYVPTFFLPYINNALGFSNSTSIATLACLLACMSIGRILTGYACDRVGSMNALFFTSDNRPGSYVSMMNSLAQSIVAVATLGVLPWLKPHAHLLPDPFIHKGMDRLQNLLGVTSSHVKERKTITTIGSHSYSERAMNTGSCSNSKRLYPSP